MRRRAFITVLAGVALVCTHSVVAQTADRVRRIGILFSQGERDLSTQAGLSALRLGLQERGWTEGRNIAFEIRYVAGRPDRAPALVAELVGSNVEMILTSGTELIQAAQKARERRFPVQS